MAQVRKCDVVIAGGGPAGAASARRLVSSGFEVIVLDNALPGARRPCSGIVSPQAQTRIAGALGDKAEEIYLESYSALTFHFPASGHSFSAGFESGPARRADRALLTGRLLEARLHESSGAEVHAPMEVLSIAEDGERVQVLARGPDGDVAYQCRWLVGADGADSSVRSLIYPGLEQFPVFRALRTVHRVIDNSLDPAHVHFWPDPSHGLLAWAHAWDDRLALGILRAEGEGISELHDRFIDLLEQDHGVRLAPPDESADGRVFLGPAITNRYMPGKGKVLLTGEAAGFINPSIEGISIALSTGAIAGEAVARAHNVGVEPLKLYRELLAKEARACTDKWNPTRLLFSSPHEADLRAGFKTLSQDEQHAVGGDLMRHMKTLKPYGWTLRVLWLGLIRFLTGRYPSGGWL